MDYERCPSLPAMLFAEADRSRERPFLWVKRDGTYRPTTYRAAGEAVARIARALRRRGIRPGDRVLLIAENRPEWVIADFAIMTAGAITVPAYVTSTVSDHAHILADSGARAAIVSTADLARRVREAAAPSAPLAFIAVMDGNDAADGAADGTVAWADLAAEGAEDAGAPGDVDVMLAGLGRDEVCCIIYTSGTGGAPKGVMLTHANLLANARSAYHLLEQLGVEDEIFLSFLPMSHSYEHTAGTMFPVSIGAQVYFAEGADTLSANLLEVRPTLMTAVPRLYEILHERIRRGVERQGALSRGLFHLALRLGAARHHGRMTLPERVLDRVVDRLVRDKIRARFGGRLKALVSGGAPLNPEIGLFFTALGLRLLQGYGQTEAAPVIAANPPNRIKLHTVGPPLVGVEVRIAEDGEILVRGDNVMKGYWRDEEATARTVVDGWLHTGDVGRFDADGYLEITDRKKDFIKNAGGDMIAPQRIEGLLALEPAIAQAMVHGDRRAYLVALLVPNEEEARVWAKREGRPADLAALAVDEDYRKHIGQVVARVNERLPTPERIRRFHLAPEPFSIANGMLTPTLKIRRHRIREVYGPVLDALYG